ncbi:MAG TPA: DUF480 domain-containing protein [Chthoniobacteraceae bacterium]|nr:DUF480 domain-containing protein [Chthoniobacteraceae bacterium]
MSLLSFPETRVLGCLIEKELTTPDYYPLTLNSLVTACNQTTNREPVVAFDETTVAETADALRGRQMVTAVFGAGSRVKKYRHDFLDHYTLERKELALLAVLLLRGPQTPGELRQRSERMAGRLLTLPEIEESLEEMSKGQSPLVRAIAPGPGRKEKRYVHLLAGEPDEALLASAAPAVQVIPYTPAPSNHASREELAALQEEVAGLREELQTLRETFETFRKQFE